MASTKFTKETIMTSAKSIKQFAEYIIETIEHETDETALCESDRYAQKIVDCVDDINFRLKDCDEY